MNKKYLIKIFEYYKQKYKLDTNIRFVNDGIKWGVFRPDTNEIILCLNHFPYPKNNKSCYIINNTYKYNTRKEVIIFTLLHEIKHALDEKLKISETHANNYAKREILKILNKK
jgi:hypothetical protein